LIFNVESKLLTKALEDIQGKGMYLGDKGFSNSKLSPYVFMELEGNVLRLWNGDSTCGITLTIEVTGNTNGSFTGSAETIVPYLKKFDGEITVSYNDFLAISAGTKTASIPAAIQHPNFDAITRIRQMISDISFDPVPEKLYDFGSKKFEGAIQLTSESFNDAISGCELVKSGVYLINSGEGSVSFSSENGTANAFCETLTPIHSIGEPATLQYSGPLHKFFKDQPLVNFYVRDEFPLLIVGHSKMAVKAPYTRGD
tara:strand:+ start:81 stop:848 length:768 start_codon:yes stop_codon:yes gene_type:complete